MPSLVEAGGPVQRADCRGGDSGARHRHPTFKPKNWALCNWPNMLEEAISYMEAYASAEAGMYLTPKAWRKKGDLKASGIKLAVGGEGGRSKERPRPGGLAGRDETLSIGEGPFHHCLSAGKTMNASPPLLQLQESGALPKGLQGLQVGKRLGLRGRFTVRVTLNEKRV